MSLLRAWSTLFMLSFRRLLWSVNTMMILFPLTGCALFLLRRRYQSITLFPRAFDLFSHEFVLVMFASFIVPVCALAYATTSIGGDREDRTLLFLLVRPVPRALIFLAKFTATLPLVLGLVMGSFYVYCRLAGPVGQLAMQIYQPAIFCMTLAYVALFHLFAVSFRYATILALVYSLFMEFFLGNMPGIIKRLAVNYYGRSLIYDVGVAHGVQPPSSQLFDPVPAQTAMWTLLLIAAVGTLAGLIVFQRREYRDLT